MIEKRMGLAGRAVMITGAGAGIGRATARAFSQAGAKLAITDIDLAAADAVANEIHSGGGEAISIQLDVSREEDAEAAVARSVDRFGKLDVLVNNAGIGARVPTTELPTERWRQALAVGVDGCFFCSRAAGRHMTARRSGAVVNVASIMGLSGGGLYPNLAYHAAKGALVNMTRALSLEWAPYGIRVNAVAPGFVDTRLVEPLMADPAMRSAILNATPLGRLITPEEVADAIVFLASDLASMITGHTLPVDGGWLAR
jgi:NAD(P)-dependent dehydrogenase (short-subunit alcohol dehydrogenase family)